MEPKPGDIISYVVVDFNNPKQYLLHNDIRPELEKWMGRIIDAFNIEYDDTVDMITTILKELPAQTGYDLPQHENARVVHVGCSQISAGSDRISHLFIINTTGITQDNTNILDKVRFDNVWCDRSDVVLLNSWKPITILIKTEFIAKQKELRINQEKQ